MLVGFAPAGPADMIARVVADRLTEFWGQPVLVENATGAGANVAADRTIKAGPDGYTILMARKTWWSTNVSPLSMRLNEPIRFSFSPA